MIINLIGYVRCKIYLFMNTEWVDLCGNCVWEIYMMGRHITAQIVYSIQDSPPNMEI